MKQLNNTTMNLKLYGSEKFNPEQLMRFEKYVDSKYPQFHFRKRRKYAKEVLKHQNKQLINSHIYPGVKLWASSPTLAERLAIALRKLAVRLKESIKELKFKEQYQKLKLKLSLRKNSQQHGAVIIGVMDLHGGNRCIKGTAAKAFHLINKLLNTLGLSLRLNPSGFPVKILRTKPKLQHKVGVCEICGNKLGHWYRDELEVTMYPYNRVSKNVFVRVSGGTHYLCLLPTDKEGVLL